MHLKSEGWKGKDFSKTAAPYGQGRRTQSSFHHTLGLSAGWGRPGGGMVVGCFSTERQECQQGPVSSTRLSLELVRTVGPTLRKC